MSGWLIRVVNLIAVVAILAGYNIVTIERKNADEAAKKAVEQEYEEWKEENAELLAAADADSGTADTAESGAYKDGVYTGSAQGFGGPVEVQVTVVEGAITDVEILSAEKEDAAYFSMAQEIIPSILEAQTAEVDTISGATFSSTGIKNAVALALEGAN